MMKTNSNSENSHRDHDDDNCSSLQGEKWCCHETLYKFHGFWFTQTYLQTTQKVLEDFKPLPKDVILASFPKTGTTWLKALLHSITNRSHYENEKNPLISNHPQDLIPSLETNLYVNPRFHTIDDNDPNGVVRIFGTHIPHQIIGDVLNACERVKIVYVTRNPKDTLVSLWNFMQGSKAFRDDPWELGVAVDQFCSGKVAFGSYYDHVLGYREESVKRPEEVFFVTFEEMKENLKKHVRELGEFLGCPFDEGEDGEMEIGGIVSNCSFEKLSNHEVNKSSELPIGFPLPYSSFFRKGEVGDYRNYLDDEMIEKIDCVTKDKFHGNGFVYGI